MYDRIQYKPLNLDTFFHRSQDYFWKFLKRFQWEQMLINSLNFAKISEESEEAKFGNNLLRTLNLGTKSSN